MNVSEVLNKAADLIEERGWTQGPEGWGCGPNLCLEGGLSSAMGGQEADYADYAVLYASPAYAAVAAYLDRDPQPSAYPIKDTLWMWNDAEFRTASEVVEALRACAVIEAAKETDVRVVEPREAVSA